MNRVPYLLISLSAILSLSGCTAGVMGGTAGGLALTPERRTAGTVLDDQTTKIKVQSALNKDKEMLKNSHISSMVYNDTVLLVGQTPNSEYRQRAFELVAGVPSVRQVYNELEIEEPISASQRLQDTWLTTQIKTKLLTNRDIGPGRISVLSENGIVYMMGMLTKEEEQVAVEIARRVSGVRKVIKVFQPVENRFGAPIG